ncbi:SWR1 complex bromodomain subunit bdf1-like [Salvia miltiorrhiza]|uniref:SWR1 complex bromodomain subunit bdf1-like n=1 Tax=Salvia miltiorrhiza TaxID=226208 RepID=UPI0025AB7AFA|nr:SWR1 complex bromodomain subunit bdf1-like [Salvia miltiorrhiza]
MGKVPTAAAATTEMKRKKKKGRPLKNPPPLSTPPKAPLSNSASRRSTRRNPNHLNSPPRPDFDDDEDERKEKKVKLVVRLPQSDEKTKADEKNQQQLQQSGRHSHDSDSGSESGSDYDSDPEDEDREGPAKKRKIIGDDGGSDDGGLDQDKEIVMKATDTPLQGSPLESGPTAALPEKKLLVFILDRLQKKDTYGVFSEPVDPDELPDYFDIIKHPMDFGTVRKKLESGAYKNLDELEADVDLICSNAMQYNAADTVYYRQARTIQELAKRDFKNLKHEGADGAPQPKIVRRGRPPSSKNQKKPLETSPVDRVGTDLSSGATLANGEDKATGSNSYNLRKASPLFRYRSSDPFMSPYSSRNGENYSEYSTDWNNEFPASILRADMKYGKKQFTVDENKRDTYRQFDSMSLGDNSPILYHSNGNMKRLVPVGLQEALAYARSLARYAANLGPAAWKMASKKIEAVLPAGVQYGPGWVGDNGAPPQPLPTSIEKQKSFVGDFSSSKLVTPRTSSVGATGPCEAMVEAVKKLNNQNEVAGQGDASSWRTQLPPQQNHMHNSHRNGFTGMFGYGGSSARAATPQHPVAEGFSSPSPKVEIASPNDRSSNHSSAIEQAKLPEGGSSVLPPGYQTAQVKSVGEAETRTPAKSPWQGLPAQQQRYNLAVPPDLNVRVPAGSPGPSLQIGSPQQPDLALQL